MMRSGESFSLIGASRVGITLAVRLVEAGFQPHFLFNRTESRLQEVRQWVIFERVSHRLSDFITPTDWLIIAVADDALASVAAALEQLPLAMKSVKAFHTSGAWTADILAPLRAAGARTGSFHPTFSVSSIPLGLERIPGAVIGCEGELQSELIALAGAIGACGIPLEKSQKEILHLGAVLVNNYLALLVAAAHRLCRREGIQTETARRLLRDCIRQGITTGWSEPLKKYLTGPFIRGDMKTIEKHLALLENDPELKQLYTAFMSVADKFIKEKTNPNG